MNAADELMMLTRVFLSLVVVVVLALIAAKMARRAGMQGSGQGIRVLERVPLNREASLTVVQVDDRALILGLTSQTVTVISEFTPEKVEQIYSGQSLDSAGVRVRKLPDGSPEALLRHASQDAATPGRPAVRGTGAVLDPRTWRQGVSALRDLTTRRRG